MSQDGRIASVDVRYGLEPDEVDKEDGEAPLAALAQPLGLPEFASVIAVMLGLRVGDRRRRCRGVGPESEAFGAGYNGPFLLAVDSPRGAAENEGQLARLQAAVAGHAGHGHRRATAGQ